MARIRCFLLERTAVVNVKLRRYAHGHVEAHEKYGYHNAERYFGEEPVEKDPKYPGSIANGMKAGPAHDDPRWPTTCSCGYTFTEDDEWQYFAELIYRRVDTGETILLRDVPPGAMWYAEWMDTMYTPQLEHCLMVETPGGAWCIDGQANNCGKPDDWQQKEHHCWVIEGTTLPDITVGKNGPTCSAGGGSIQCGSYHGFLRNGWLED